MEGLSSSEALDRLNQYGPNTIPEEKEYYFLKFFKKFWAPIPWMLEGIIALELVLKKPAEASIIFALLLFNVTLSFFQEEKAKKALLLLQKQLHVLARVLRDDQWRLLPAAEIVPGDLLRIRMGDILPADVEVVSGNLSIDPSTLTGESFPVEIGPGSAAYAGSVVRRGEAFAKVQSTGMRTFYGKTASLLHFSKAPNHLERMIFHIIKYLVTFDAVLVTIVFLYSISFQLPLLEVIPFSLLLFIAAVPVALPAMFTLTGALGSLELARSGILVTRLSAIEEAAAMSILCVDKTGTLTINALELTAVHPTDGYTKKEILAFAAMASEPSTQDAIDLAIFSAHKDPLDGMVKHTFIPFDPERKYTEAWISYKGKSLQIRKGSSEALSQGSSLEKAALLEADGSRVLAINIDGVTAGLLIFEDPLREDSSQTIQEIQNLGIRVIMLTGDSPITAQAIAKKAGIGNRVITRKQLEDILEADVIAGIFPEDKFHIIDALQKKGYVCGMTGDGVNDAPALKKAEVGIAVANATEVAKASASLVLTQPGLHHILKTIQTSRRIYQRMLTYTLNKIIKTLEISVLLGGGLILVQNFVISPLLIVVLLFANDFVSMSLSTDRVSYSQNPDRWDMRKLMRSGGIFALLILGFSFGILILGHHFFPLSSLRTLVFLTLVFTGQFTVYLVRERHHFWHSLPSPWVIASSILDLAVIAFLAAKGILMAPLPISLILGLLGCLLLYYLLLDFIKVKIFRLRRI